MPPPGPQPDAPRSDAPQGDAGRTDAARSDDARTDAARPDAARSDVTRTDGARPDATRSDLTPSDAARSDAARPDVTRTDAIGPDASRPNATSTAASRPESTTSDATRPTLQHATSPPSAPQPSDPPPSAPSARRERLLASVARNALAGGGRQVVAAVAALAVVPFALRVLGAERYGVWAIAGAVLASLRLLDLGLDRALSRAVARAASAGTPGAAAPAVATARALLAATATAAVAVVWLLRDPLTALLFAVPPALRAEAAWVVAGTAVVAAVELGWLPWRAALEGIGRLDLAHGVETGQRVLSAAGVVLVLGAGWGLRGLVLKNLVTALLAGWALQRLLAARAPALASARPSFDRERSAALLRHGRWVQGGHLASLVVEPAHKALLAHGPGLAAVAAYELAIRVAGQLAGLLQAMGQAIYPAAAAEAGAQDADPRALYAPVARYLAWLAWPAFTLTAVLALPFTTAWLHGSADAATVRATGLALAALAAGAGGIVLAMPAFLVLQARDAAGARAATGAVTAHVVVSVGIAALLAPRLGLAGVVAGAALGSIAGAVAAWTAHARLGAGWRATLGPVFQPRVMAAAGAAALAAWTLANAAPGWPSLIAAGTTAVLLYAGLLFATGAVRPADRALAARLAANARARRGRGEGEERGGGGDGDARGERGVPGDRVVRGDGGTVDVRGDRSECGGGEGGGSGAEYDGHGVAANDVPDAADGDPGATTSHDANDRSIRSR